MESENLEFLQLLTISSVELWELKDNQFKISLRGFLEVLFNKDLDLVMLKLHNFKYALDKSLRVIGSSDNEHNQRCYLLPGVDTCYLLRVGVPSSEPIVINLETVFEKTCEFLRNPDLESRLKSMSKGSDLFSKATSLLKEVYIKGSDVISKGVAKVVSKAQVINPSHVLVRKLDDMKLTDKNLMSSENFKKSEVIGLQEVSKMIPKSPDIEFWTDLGPNTKGISVEANVKESHQYEGEEGESLKHGEEARKKRKKSSGKAKKKLDEVTSKISETAENLKEPLKQVTEIKDKLEMVRKDQPEPVVEPPVQKVAEPKDKSKGSDKNVQPLVSKEENLEGFHEVTTGISEEVTEFKKKEKAGKSKLYISDNPFIPLGKKNLNVSQPIENSEVRGGDLKNLTRKDEKVSRRKQKNNSLDVPDTKENFVGSG